LRPDPDPLHQQENPAEPIWQDLPESLSRPAGSVSETPAAMLAAGRPGRNYALRRLGAVGIAGARVHQPGGTAPLQEQSRRAAHPGHGPAMAVRGYGRG